MSKTSGAVRFPDFWSEADLESLPDDGHRYEILRGTLIMTPPAHGHHQIRSSELFVLLHGAAPPGWRVVPELGLRVPNGNLVPDLVVLHPGTTIGVWHEAKDVALVVEVASPSTEFTDKGAKVELYAEAGIPSYWRLERDGTLIVHELAGAAYTTVATVPPGETWTAERPFAVTVDPAALLAD
jgi:Uma2 family endonuclease